MKTRIITTIIAVLLGLQVYAQNVKRPDTYYYNRGLECLREGKESDAYDYFLNETKDNPKNGYAYVWLAYILYENELYGDGLSMLDKALKNLPSKDKEFISMAYTLKGDIYAAMEDFDDALTYYNKAIKTMPKDPDCYDRRAEFYYYQEKYDLSDLDYEKMIELDPAGHKGYMGKGRNANMQKRYEDAIKLFDQVVKLHGKDYSQCYSFRAEAYAGLKQYEKAADDIITAMGIDWDPKALHLMQNIMADSASTVMISKLKIQQLKEPNMATWPYLTAMVYESIENYEKAIENYSKANSINVSDVTSCRISNCYFELNNYEEAFRYINEAIQLNPSNTSYWIYRADYEYETGLLNQALEDIGSCIETTPEYFYYYYRRGFYEDNSGMIDNAIEDYSTAILLEPNYFYSFLGRGDMYMKKGMEQQAKEDYRKVIEKDTVPSSASCAQYAFLALGERDHAVEYNQRILDSFPNDPGCYYDAACLYARMGESEKALGYLRTAFEKGYRRFAHTERDDDLDSLREIKEFYDLLEEYRVKYGQSNNAIGTVQEEVTVEIPFTKSNGVTEVQCTINGLPLHFVFDTGASDVTMSMVEASFMMKNKYLTPLDVVGKQNYLTADGNVSEGTVINLKSVKFGDLELTNVRASVVKSQNAPLLLGQSVLGRLGKIEIDNEKRVIKVTQKSLTNNNGTSQVYQIIEEMPEFPGGLDALVTFVSNNLKYPQTAQETGIQGKVHVQFIVEPDGSISNIKISKGIGGGCDEEAIRVVSIMPRWKPGKHEGKFVRVSYILPINFKLKDDGQ